MYIRYGGKEYSDYKPNYPEYEEVTDKEELIIPLDAVIVVDRDGEWDYEDLTFSWAQPDATSSTWYTSSSEYPPVKIGTVDEIVECVDDLLSPMIPFAKGRYLAKGEIHLVFEISGIDKSREYLGYDEDEDPYFDTEYYTDAADVEFMFEESSINNLEIETL